MKQIRIAITGPECSGKSFLSNALATSYQTSYVPEYARAYLEQLDKPYTNEDLYAIAQGQMHLWDEFQGDVLVADTDMLVMCIWYFVKNKTIPPAFEILLKEQHFDHYFLCKPDIPWEFDVLRENPEDRDWLFSLYLSKIKEMNVAYTIIEGDYEQRTQIAKTVLKELIGR